MLLSSRPEHSFLPCKLHGKDGAFIELVEELFLCLSQHEFNLSAHGGSCLLACSLENYFDLCLSWDGLRAEVSHFYLLAIRFAI